MKISLVVFLFSLILGLSACQSHQSVTLADVSPITDMYMDSSFPGYQQIPIESAQQIFMLDDDMRAMVRDELVNERNIYKRSRKLLEQIFNPNDADLVYTSGADLTAAQTYHQKIANCLSLTILAYALAQEADLLVYFQQVNIPEYWVRHGKVNMLAGHVNLLVKAKLTNKVVLFKSNSFVIDFDPYVFKRSFRTKSIDKNTIIAMFYNNKGAKFLADKDYTRAYAYFKRASEAAPTYSSGLSNLALLYRFTGHLTRAESLYRYAIKLDKTNLTAMANLAVLLRNEGELAEAEQIDHALKRKRAKNPYYHAMLADDAFYQGDPDQAVKHYKKAIKLAKNNHEFYFGLAKVYFNLNKIEQSKSAMRKALVLNRLPEIQRGYVAKMALLNQQRIN
jgi:Flp pilus assembly protein TadD